MQPMPPAHDAFAAPDLHMDAAMQHIGREGGQTETDMRFILDFLRQRPNRREAELAYLSEAVSRYDLERREREIAGGKFATLNG